MFCRACGAEIPDDSGVICSHCGQNPGTKEMNAESFGLPEGHGLPDGPPFEHRERDGFIATLWETCKGVLLNPRETFMNMNRRGWGNPILFVVIVSALGGFFNGLWSFLFNVSLYGFSGLPGGGNQPSGTGLPTALMLAGSALNIPLAMVVSIIGGLIGMFLYGGIYHLVLMAFKANKFDFEATARVCAYSSAVDLLQIVPFLGGVIAGIWKLVVLFIGIRECHETTTGTALGVILIPLAACCVCGIGIWVIVIGFLFAAFNAGGGM